MFLSKYEDDKDSEVDDAYLAADDAHAVVNCVETTFDDVDLAAEADDAEAVIDAVVRINNMPAELQGTLMDSSPSRQSGNIVTTPRRR